jgi:hypothetical protein
MSGETIAGLIAEGSRGCSALLSLLSVRNRRRRAAPSVALGRVHGHVLGCLALRALHERLS